MKFFDKKAPAPWFREKRFLNAYSAEVSRNAPPPVPVYVFFYDLESW